MKDKYETVLENLDNEIVDDYIDKLKPIVFNSFLDLLLLYVFREVTKNMPDEQLNKLLDEILALWENETKKIIESQIPENQKLMVESKKEILKLIESIKKRSDR